jgi:hypothetical protein
VIGGAPAESGRARSGLQGAPAWLAVDAAKAIGADFGAEGAGIDASFQNASGVNTGEAIGPGIECVGCANGSGSRCVAVDGVGSARQSAFE